MKQGMKKLGLMLLASLAAGAALAAGSLEIEGAASSRGSGLQAFSTEIRGPGGRRLENPDSQVKPVTIPDSRLHPRRHTQSAAAAGSSAVKDLGFFTNPRLPADYDVNRYITTVAPKSGETLHSLAERTRDVKVTINQQKASIFRKNFRCFVNGRLDSMSRGCQLRIPSAEQALAEDKELAKKLLAQGGVSKAEYDYAMANCPSGVCGVPAAGPQTAAPAKKDEGKNEGQQTASISLDTGSQGSGVTYYEKEKDKEQAKPKNEGQVVKPLETLILVDTNGKELTSDEVLAGTKPPAQQQGSGKTSATGSSLTFDRDAVRAENAKGEIIEEVSKKYDGRFSDIDSRLTTSSSDINQINREVSELRHRLETQDQKLDRMVELLEQKNAQAQEVIREDSIPVSLVAGGIILIFILLMIISFMTYRMRRKFRKEMDVDSDDDDLDQAGEFDHLMALDPIAMVPTNEKEVAPESPAQPQAMPVMGGIDLNADSDEKPKQKSSESFIIADDGGDQGTLDESSFASADIGTEEVVNEDPALRTRQNVDVSDNIDLVPQDLPTSAPARESVDLAGNLTTRDIDRIISQADDGKSIDPASPLAQASGTRGNSPASTTGARTAAEDIDDILASMGEPPSPEPAPVSDSAAADDIDSILASLTSAGEERKAAPAPSEKASEDDIDAILAAAGGSDAAPEGQKAAPAPKPDLAASDDDIDAILAAAGGGDQGGSKLKSADPVAGSGTASEEDIDAILASIDGSAGGKADGSAGKSGSSAPSADSGKASEDDIDAILAAAAEGKNAAPQSTKTPPAPEPDLKASDDDIDAILAAAAGGSDAAPKDQKAAPAPGPDLKASDDDIDAILAAAAGGSDTAPKGKKATPAPEPDLKASDDDIDAILAAAAGGSDTAPKGKKTTPAPEPDLKATDDDIDAILAAAAPAGVQPGSKGGSAQDDIDDILSSVSAARGSDPVAPAAVAESATVAADVTVSDDDIDALLNSAQEAPSMSDEDAKDNISLVKAYLSIDDKAAARDTLNDIIANAGPEFRKEAESMLSKLK